jgi:natural product biosynthesis luciferase-like monooxygenase protein
VDFALRPENYADRRTVLVEYADQVRRLWRGETLAVLDGHGNPAEVGIFPPPVQPELPVWVTSAGGVETFRSAGRIGAGLLTHLLGQDVDELAEKVAQYRAAVAERPGADGWPGHVVVMVHTFLGDDEDEVRETVRAPMTDYLRSSLGLLLGSKVFGGRTVDPAKLRPDDVEFIVDRSFHRYFDDGGLLGTVPKAERVVERLRQIGVDEIACLVDFGLPAKTVLAALEPLDRLRQRVNGTAGR